jgi:signal transduction histidine kinase
MLVAGVAYVVVWATTPADCTWVNVRPESWATDGVVVVADTGCPVRTGDLVTAVDGEPLATGAEEAWSVGDVVDFTVVRADRQLSIPVPLTQPDLWDRFAPAWSTLLFVFSLLAVASYVFRRRPGAATSALLILAAGLAGSTLPTLLELPTVGVLDPSLRWLYLTLTEAVFVTAWSAGLAFALLFPHPFGWLAGQPRWARIAVYAAPVGCLLAWAVVGAAVSVNRLEWAGTVFAGGAVITVASLLVMTGIAASWLWRASDPLERQQMRWLVGTGVLAGSVTLAGWFIPEILIGQGLPTAWIGLPGLAFVIGLGVAISRYRLFDLDIVLNRGLVYGLLTVSVVTLYLFVVALTAGVMRGEATTPASIIATAAVAVAVNPLRVLLQRGVDRMMYGDREDPYSALSRLGQRLEDAGSADRLLPAVADDIVDALRVPYVAIEVAATPVPVEAGRKPRWLTNDMMLELPLVDRGEPIGRLLVSPRTPTEPFSRADRRLIDDLTRRVSAAARELSLRSDLQRSRERLVLAREEERRRLRRALHDEVGPAIAGLGLRTEAARRLVEIDPPAASDALAAVRAGTQELVTDIRRLAYDLRPPALDELGLAGALRRYAQSIDSPQVTVTAVEDLGELPAAVEAAAYRIAVEAVTNAVRHAEASLCSVDLGAVDGSLQVRVADDGHGLPDDVHAGIGMSAMRERAAELGGNFRVEARAGGGTIVVAMLPMGGDGR